MGPMTAPSGLIVCRPESSRHSLIVACDTEAASWLSASFDALGSRSPFDLGDLCRVRVQASREQGPAFVMLAPGAFRWSVPTAAARHYGQQIAAMARYRGPCHQYLDADPDLPMIRVSKDEYDADTLRRMQAAAF
jgi:hypothetical protein